MSEKFFASFETKHLIIGICCSLAGWGGSQLYTIGIQQAAMLAYQEDHAKQLTELASLPPEMAVVQSTLGKLALNDISIAETLKDHEEKLYSSDTRITVLEVKKGVSYE